MPPHTHINKKQQDKHIHTYLYIYTYVWLQRETPNRVFWNNLKSEHMVSTSMLIEFTWIPWDPFGITWTHLDSLGSISIALSLYLPISLSIYLSLHLSISPSLYLSISLSLYLSISLSLYEAPRRHPGGTQEAPRKLPRGSQEAPKGLPGLPRRLPEGSQEAPRRLPGGSQEPGQQKLQEASQRGWGHFVSFFTTFFAKVLFILYFYEGVFNVRWF